MQGMQRILHGEKGTWGWALDPLEARSWGTGPDAPPEEFDHSTG